MEIWGRNLHYTALNYNEMRGLSIMGLHQSALVIIDSKMWLFLALAHVSNRGVSYTVGGFAP